MPKQSLFEDCVPFIEGAAWLRDEGKFHELMHSEGVIPKLDDIALALVDALVPYNISRIFSLTDLYCEHYRKKGRLNEAAEVVLAAHDCKPGGASYLGEQFRYLRELAPDKESFRLLYPTTQALYVYLYHKTFDREEPIDPRDTRVVQHAFDLVASSTSENLLVAYEMELLGEVLLDLHGLDVGAKLQEYYRQRGTKAASVSVVKCRSCLFSLPGRAAISPGPSAGVAASAPTPGAGAGAGSGSGSG